MLDRTGVARAAISVAGPVTRITGDDIGQMARRVKAAASQLMSIEAGLVERHGLPLTLVCQAGYARSPCAELIVPFLGTISFRIAMSRS